MSPSNQLRGSGALARGRGGGGARRWVDRRVLFAVTAGVSLAVTARGRGARAETVEATSTTLVTGRQDPRDGVVHTTIPVYELVSVRAGDFHLRGVDDLNVLVSGWGGLSLNEPIDGRRGLGDLDVAFAEAKVLRRRVALRLGRQLLMAGAGRNLAFDGLGVTVMPVRWAGLSAQAGVPVTPRFAVDRGDTLVAGRAFVKPSFDTEAGLSFLQVMDDSQVARRDVAIDARVARVQSLPLSLSAFALVSLPERRLAEGNLAATWQLGRLFEVTGDYRRTAPDLFLPRNSIFSVFSQESRDEAGAYVYWKIVPRLKLQGDYHVVVDATGTGQDGSLKATGTLGADGRHAVGLESRKLALPHTGFTLARAFAILRVTPRLVGTADASAFFFDADVNGQRQSFVGAATLAYDFRPEWRALVTGIGSVTPFAERRFEGMAKIVYQLTAKVRQVKP